jgi:hypothetical protein
MKKQEARAYSKPNPSLAGLSVLVGEWNTSSTHPLYPGAVIQGHVSFEWLEKGAFLVMRSEVKQPGPPSGMAIFGRDESTEEYSMLYFDERGVSRIYGVSLNNGIWKMWRSAPGFSQRFTGIFSADGSSIAGTWELARGASDWQRDLESTYSRLR